MVQLYVQRIFGEIFGYAGAPSPLFATLATGYAA